MVPRDCPGPGKECPVWDGGPISQIPPLQLYVEHLCSPPPVLYAVLSKILFGEKSLMLNKSLEIMVMINGFECCLCVSSFIAYKVLETMHGPQ